MPTVTQIQQAVAAEFGITIDDIRSPRRYRKFARPRQVAMYLSKELTKQSRPRRALTFRRDHSTMYYGETVIAKTNDPEILAAIDRIRQALFYQEGAAK